MKEDYSSEGGSNCCTRNGLSVCLAVWLIITMTCLGFLSYLQIKDYVTDSANPCEETECIKASAEIIEFIDKKIDPCTDFHEFVCGNFMKTAYEKQFTHALKFESDRLRNKINSFIVEPLTKNDIQPVVMQKMYFQSCFKEKAIDENNNTLFFLFLNDRGGWPLLMDEEWTANNFSWIENMKRAVQLGLPFDWFLDVDIYDNDGRYLLQISKPKSCSNLENRLSVGDRTSFVSHIRKNFKDHDVSIYGKIVDIINFEEELFDICHIVENDTLSVKKVFEFAKIWLTPNSECLDFLAAITDYRRTWTLSSEIAYLENYIIRLQDLLQRTEHETIANYIGWKIVEYFAPYLSEPIRETYNDDYLSKILEEDVDRFEFCLQDTKQKFNLVSETMYIRENTNPLIKKAGEEMVVSIKEEFKQQIKNIQWISNETMDLDYYENFEIFIGGPEDIFEDDIFEKFLDVGQLHFRSDNIIQMIVDWSQSTFITKINMIGQTSKASLLNFAYEGNKRFGIFLDKDQKAILVPATMLHGVIFDVNRPYYLNYGGLGSFISKKLIEEFLAVNSISLSDECLIESVNTYSRYPDASPIQLNYADLFGRHIAYNAYQKFVEQNGEESRLVGLPYTPNKLFWIKSSTSWCYQDLPNEVSTGVHQDMFKYRIIETAKNSPYFGNDFQCPEGSRMNPEKKCKIF